MTTSHFFPAILLFKKLIRSITRGTKGLDVTHGSIIEKLFLVSFPIMLTSLTMTLFEFIDSMWLGRYSSSGIAAIQISRTIIWTLMSFGMGIVAGGSTIIAQAKGARLHEETNHYAGQITVFMLIVSLGVATIILLFSEPILLFFNTPASVLPEANDFLFISLGTAPILFLSIAVLGILNGIGNTIIPFVLTVIAVIINAVLDPFLIFGWWIFPEMGVKGAAIATVGSRLIMVIVGYYLIFKGKVGITIHWDHLKWSWQRIKHILKIGIPNSIGSSGGALGYLVLVGLVSSVAIDFYGGKPIIINAFGIQNTIVGMYLIAAMGLQNAVGIMVGQNIGANNLKRAEQSVWKAIWFGLVFLVLGFFITYFFPEDLSKFFIPSYMEYSQETADSVVQIFNLVSHSAIILGLIQIMMGAFQGAGYTLPIMVLSIGRIWILRLPVAYLMAYTFQMGEHGIWWSMMLSNYGIGIVGIIWFFKGSWKKKSLIKAIV